MDDIKKKFMELLNEGCNAADQGDYMKAQAIARLQMIHLILSCRSVAIITPQATLANLCPDDFSRMMFGINKVKRDLENIRKDIEDGKIKPPEGGNQNPSNH